MRARDARWLLLAIFPIGYLACQTAIGPLDRSFFVLTVLNMLLLGVLLSRMSGPPEQTLWVWGTLVVFLTGFFLKMYWFAWKLNDAGYINANYYEVRWVTPDRIASGYGWVTLGFAIFCLSATVVLMWTRPSAGRPEVTGDRVLLVNATTQLVVALTLAYLLLTLVQIRLNYGVLGIEKPELPGRLGTVLTFLRQNVVPSLLLLAVWLFDRIKPRRAAVTSVVLVIFGLLDALASTSRGSILAFAAPVVLLWLVTNRFTHSRRVAAFLIAVLAVVMFPVVTAQRQQRINPSASGRNQISPGLLVDSAFLIVTRPSGAEGVWFGIDYSGDLSVPRFLTFARRIALTSYYTKSVVRVLADNDFRAPGIIGGQMIIGGGPGVVVLMTLTVLGLGLLWSALRQLRTWPVALAIATPAIANFVSAGVFDFPILIRVVLAMGCVEFAYRRITSATFRDAAVLQPRAGGAGAIPAHATSTS